MGARRLLLLAEIRHYSMVVRSGEANKAQEAALESVVLERAKCILGSFSRTCNELRLSGEHGIGCFSGL